MAMPAMGRGHIIGIRQVSTNANRDGLFSGIQVDEARNLAFPKLDFHSVFKHPDNLHALVHPYKLLFAEFHAAPFFAPSV